MKIKKKYESSKIYSNKYNKININVQLDRKLIENLRNKLDNKQTIKEYIENLIRDNYDKNI